jgi:hypothetical protein
MTRRLALAFLLALPLALLSGPAAAERLVVALSTEIVRIASNFAGDSISLFGVIERRGAVSRTGPYEVVVIVKGPPERVLVQKRERVFGIWVNDAGEVFEAIPAYYGLFTTPGASALVMEEEGPAADPSLRWLGGYDERAELRRAIAQRRKTTGLYIEDLDAVIKLTDTFFRTEIPLPSVVNDGPYEVDVILYSDGVPLDTTKTRFLIAKVGFEQRLFEMSRDEPLVYGLAAVLLALVTGYVGGVVFRRG